MWAIDQWICFASLSGLAWIDVKKKEIPVLGIVGGFIASVGYQLFTRKVDIWLVIGGALLGGGFLLLSWITKEGIGYGDSLGILILGIYLGMWKLAELLSAAFFLLFFAAMVLFFKKKNSAKYGIPFYPFLAAAYLGTLLMEKGVV